MNNIQTQRDIKIDIINGKYKCISAYQIPDKIDEWLECPNCGLKPLVWEYNNGRSTGCGCGKNEYEHFSINSDLDYYLSDHVLKKLTLSTPRHFFTSKSKSQ